MWELLTVLGIYLVVSFVGMAALWTVAVRKGVVCAPRYFFWVRAYESHVLPTVCEAGSSNALLNLRPLGLAGATVVLLSAMYTSQLVPRDCPNQTAHPNILG
jgi:hypothetical protein